MSGLTGATAIAGGEYHTIAIKNDGTVWAWGYNMYGQLGDGTTTYRTTPVQVSGLTGATAIAGGENHTIAIKNDGAVWAWGRNEYGQLGDSTGTNRATPVQVSGLAGVVAVAGGWSHSLALKTDGTVWAWGRNSFLGVGDGIATNRGTPVQVSGLAGVVAIAGGGSHSLALKTDGTVWAWGWNDFGQLGDGTGTYRVTPVQVSGLAGVVAVAGGWGHSLALKTDGTVWAWGYNVYGQLGDGTTTYYRATPVQVSNLTGVAAIKEGGYHSLAIMSEYTTPTTTASPAGGSYTSAQSVTLACNDGTGSGCGNIYYTTDGTTPTTSSSVYSSPINISTTTTLKFFAVDVAGNAETIKTEIYAISNLSISTSSLPDGTVGSAYSAALTATGGTAPYTWSIPSGGLPPGLALNGSTDIISGTPTTAGTYGFTVKVTDAASFAATKSLSININSAPLKEMTVGILTIKADAITNQGGGRYVASGNVNINNFLYVPDGLLIDLFDTDNPSIEGNGSVAIDIFEGQRIQLFYGNFSLDAKEAKLLPAFWGFEFKPMLSIAGFEIVIEELKIVADIAPDIDPQNDEGLIVSGSFALPTILWKSQNDKIDISFKGGLSIGILSGIHFSYGIQLEGIKLGSTGWELDNLDMLYNSATQSFEATTNLKLPVFGIEATLVLKQGALDTIILDADISRLPTPIFIDGLPLILSRIAGGVENLQGPDPVRIRAGTGVQTYPRIPFMNCDGEFNSGILAAFEPMDAVIDLDGKFTLTGDTYIFKPLNTWECDMKFIKITYDGYHLAQAEGSIDWVKGIGQAKGNLNFIDILIAIAQLTVDKNAKMNGSASGKIQVPKWAPLIGKRYGDQTIASNAIYLDNESIRAEIETWLGSINIRFTQSGNIDWGINWPNIPNLFAERKADLRIAALGDAVYGSGMTDEIPLFITSPPNDMIVRLTWTTGDTDFDLLTPSGKRLTPLERADIYSKNQEINEAFYLISNPEAGEWKAVIYNIAAIGAYQIQVLGRNIPPSIELLSPQNDLVKPATVEIRWQDEDPDDNATVSLYYDVDNEGFDGVQIGENILENDEADQYLWILQIFLRGLITSMQKLMTSPMRRDFLTVRER